MGWKISKNRTNNSDQTNKISYNVEEVTRWLIFNSGVVIVLEWRQAVNANKAKGIIPVTILKARKCKYPNTAEINIIVNNALKANRENITNEILYLKDR